MAGDRRISRPDSSLPDWYIADASYRPIPIAWFAAAILLQSVLVSAVFFVFIARNGWVTIGLATLATLLVFQWSWERGIRQSGRPWQIATILVMTMQLGLIVIGTGNRL
ncbi:MAG: hypothetical protein AAF707_05130 [Pseudomonadota bacterium]